MRFIATADWQLGMTAHYLPAEARARFAQARLDVVRRIGEVAQESGAEFVLVCGDVFESNQLDRGIIARTFEALRHIDVPVVLLPGNHDALSSDSIYDDATFLSLQPAHVHVLRSNEPYRIADGVEIVGAPLFSKAPSTDLVAGALSGLEPPGNDVIRILAGHGGVSSLSMGRESEALIDVPTVTDALERGVIAAALIGDRHGTYEVAPGFWYPGAPEVTHHREDDPGNVLLVEVDETAPQDASGRHRITVEKVPVGRWRFITVSADVNSGDDVQALAARLGELPSKECTAVWLSLRGTVSTSVNAQLQQVLDEASALFARMDHWERHTDLVVMADDADFDQLGLAGFAEEALHELVDVAGGADEGAAGTAQDSLALLYRLAGGGAA